MAWRRRCFAAVRIWRMASGTGTRRGCLEDNGATTRPPPPHLQSSLHLSRSQSAHIVSPKSKDCRLTEPFIFCCGSKERLAPLEAVWRGLWQRRMRKALVMCLCIHFEKKWAERSDGDHWDDFEKKSQGQIFCHVEIRDARPSVNIDKR
jgi:hypothetical protein